MKRKCLTLAIIVVALLATIPVFAGNPQSCNIIKFSDDGSILFVGDSKSATLFAYTVTSKADSLAQMPYNIYGVDTKLASFLKTTVEKIILRDMTINPVSKEMYVAVDKAGAGTYTPVIVIINQKGTMKLFDLAKTPHKQSAITDAPTSENFTFWSGNTMRSFTFTDIKLYKGKVYVSGLSNAEFSSSLRLIDYPFTGKANSTIQVNMYHTAHDQMETRAPIRKFEILTVDQKDYLLAAYTCTPLVAIPLEELKDGASVTGKTISELGYGNTPIGIKKYTATNQETNQAYDVLLVTNKNRSAVLIEMKTIEEGIKGEGMTKPVGFTTTAGAAGTPIPLIGLLNVTDQDAYHVTGLQRNVDNGRLDLISYIKGAFFRVDQFESEFAFPTYRFSKEKEQTKQFINFVLKDMNMSKKVIK